MVQEVDLLIHHGKATFVDISMFYAGNELKHEYRKAVFKQIKHLKEHKVGNLYGISTVHMAVLQPQLIQLLVLSLSTQPTPLTPRALGAS